MTEMHIGHACICACVCVCVPWCIPTLLHGPGCNFGEWNDGGAPIGNGLPYSIPSVGPGVDPGVQAISPQMTVSHPPGGRLPLLSARPAVTFPTAGHHRPSAGTKLYCLVTEAHRCEQLAQGCYTALPRVGFEPATYWSQVHRYTRCATAPPSCALLGRFAISARISLLWQRGLNAKCQRVLVLALCLV